MTSPVPGVYPGPAGAGQTAAQVGQQIAASVPGLIPPATTRRLYSQMSVQPGDALQATAGTAEQTFTSRGQAPGPLVVGQTIRMHGALVFSTSTLAAPTQQARVRWGTGGPVLIDTGALGLLLGAGQGRALFDVTLIVRSIGTSGTVEAFGDLRFANALLGTTEAICGPSGSFSDAGNPVTVDTTQPVDLPLSVTFGAGLTRTGNTNTLRQLLVHDYRPVTTP